MAHSRKNRIFHFTHERCLYASRPRRCHTHACHPQLFVVLTVVHRNTSNTHTSSSLSHLCSPCVLKVSRAFELDKFTRRRSDSGINTAYTNRSSQKDAHSPGKRDRSREQIGAKGYETDFDAVAFSVSAASERTAMMVKLVRTVKGNFTADKYCAEYVPKRAGAKVSFTAKAPGRA